MSKNYPTYKILVDSSDFRKGKTNMIKSAFEDLFKEIEVTNFEILIHLIEKVGFSPYAEVLISCNHDEPLVFNLLKEFRAEKI